jgi:ketosteroid isomerase-like protein
VYRVRATWTAPDGQHITTTSRIIHTWLRGPDGKWLILSGMSAPVNAEGH